MKIPKFLEKLLIGKVSDERINLTRLFMANPVRDNALNYANQHMRLNGVEALTNQIRSEFSLYAEKVREIPKKETETESKKYKFWVVTTVIRNICIFAVILCFMMYVVLAASNLGRDNGLHDLLIDVTSLFMIFAILCIPFWIILNLISKKMYLSYREKIFAHAEDLCNQFSVKAQRLCDEIDGIYLNSLDPVNRQMVLMQRQQERHNEEMRRMQQQKDRELMEMQRQMLDAQQRLLEIEEEREERRKRFR